MLRNPGPVDREFIPLFTVFLHPRWLAGFLLSTVSLRISQPKFLKHHTLDGSENPGCYYFFPGMQNQTPFCKNRSLSGAKRWISWKKHQCSSSGHLAFCLTSLCFLPPRRKGWVWGRGMGMWQDVWMRIERFWNVFFFKWIFGSKKQIQDEICWIPSGSFWNTAKWMIILWYSTATFPYLSA